MVGLLQRVLNLVRSNVHELTDQHEDPERAINQFIDETTRHMAELNLEVSRASGELLQLQMKTKAKHDEALGWQKQAEVALTQGKEELARTALARKHEAERVAAELEVQAAPQQEAVALLKHSSGELQAKLDEARRKRDELITRAHRAEALTKAGDAVSKLEQGRVRDSFGAMEAKVVEKEATAEVAARPADPLAARFAELEKQASASPPDDELARLKKRLGKE